MKIVNSYLEDAKLENVVAEWALLPSVGGHGYRGVAEWVGVVNCVRWLVKNRKAALGATCRDGRTDGRTNVGSRRHRGIFPRAPKVAPLICAIQRHRRRNLLQRRYTTKTDAAAA